MFKSIDTDVDINTYSKKHIKIHIVKNTPKKQRRLEQFERHFFFSNRISQHHPDIDSP